MMTLPTLPMAGASDDIIEKRADVVQISSAAMVCMPMRVFGKSQTQRSTDRGENRPLHTEMLFHGVAGIGPCRIRR